MKELKMYAGKLKFDVPNVTATYELNIQEREEKSNQVFNGTVILWLKY